MIFSPKHRQRGFTLLEVLLAIGVSLSIGALALTELRRDSEAAQAKAVGEQARIVGNALDSYLALQYSHIIAMTDVVGAGAAGDAGPRDCTPNSDPTTGGSCSITKDTLVRNGLLPGSFSGRNAYGADYQFFIRVSGSAAMWRVEGLVITDRPYTTGAGNRYDLLGIAMQAAGADSGMTRTDADRIEGLNGTWSSEGEYPGVNQLGLLAVRAGYGTNGYSAFLRIDGTVPMTGDLDMGGRSIENANTITASGEVRAASLRAVGGVELGDSTALGASPGTSANRIRLDPTTGGQLRIRGNDGLVIQDLAGTGLATLAAGNTSLSQLTVASGASGNGTITANGNISSGANIIAASDLQAGRDLAVTRNTTIGGTLGVTGNATFTGNLTAGNLTATQQINAGVYAINNASGFHRPDLGAGGGGWYIPDTVYVRTPKSIYVDGGARVIGDVVADGNLSVGASGAGGQVQLNSAVAQGGACTGNGVLARAATGVVVQCSNGFWLQAGLNDTITITSSNFPAPGQGNPVAAANQKLIDCTNGSNGDSPASFPAGNLTGRGYKIVSGGYRLVAHLHDGPGFDAASPSASYPNGNGWLVAADQRSGRSTFQAYAVCGR